jgi:hypothetical protein
MRNFSPMAASPVRVPEGEGRGECGLEWEGFKEREALHEGAGKAEEMPMVSGERGNVGGDGADRWVPPGSERERGKRYGAVLAWAAAQFWAPGAAQLGSSTSLFCPETFSFVFCFHFCVI